MIKRFIYSVLIFGLFLMSAMQAFGQTDAMAREISQAIRQGNAREMAKYFGQNVDLTLPGSEGTFSKSQAEVILKDFFSKNAPKELSVNHQGNSRDGSVYVIGTLQTRNGQTFRTYFLLKKVSDSFRLHQVQFEPQ